jgi:hypothetical protein
MYYLHSKGNYHSNFYFTEKKYLLPLQGYGLGFNCPIIEGLQTSFVYEIFLIDASFHLLND